MKINYDDESVRALMAAAEFGLERESLRIHSSGRLSETKHPFGNDAHISRDFCENQVEIITDVFDSSEGMFKQLEEFDARVCKTLEENGELLWHFSNPPAFDDPDEIVIADIKGSDYRDYLAEKYGKVKMLLSGIHLNFSFPADTLETLWSKIGGESLSAFKNDLYTELAAKLFSYSWFIVYLTAASPVLDDSFIAHGGLDNSEKEKYSSVRCGEKGYWNFFTPVLNYNSVEDYADSIEEYIKKGDIISCSELYYPIRLKPRGKYSLENLKENGVSHIELRMIDLNPLSPLGVFKEDIDFIHLLILFLLSGEYSPLDETEQKTAIENMKLSSLYDDSVLINYNGSELSLRDAAASVLQSISEFAEKYYPDYGVSVKYQRDKIGNDSKRYACVVRKEYENDFVRKGIALSKADCCQTIV